MGVRHRNPMTRVLIFHIALVVVLSLTILSLQIRSVKCDGDGDGGLIESTCKRTPHYELCVSTLESNPESSGSGADLRGLAHAMVDTVLSKATETLEFIRALLKEQQPDTDLEKPLALCAELYIPVVKYSLPQAIEALIGGHFGFANYGISDAAKQANACDKSFAKASGSASASESPLAEKNALLTDLSEVAAAIISVLLKG